MYGLIGKIKAKPGLRDALIAILLDGIDEMPGCLSYVVASDQADADAGDCEGDLMDLRVALPRDAFLAFAAERPRRDGFAFACGPLQIVVEVDVRDSHRVRRAASSTAGQSEPS